MRQFNRKIHLIAGLGISGLVLLFFITGYLIINSQGKEHPEPEQTTRTVELKGNYNVSSPDGIEKLKDELGISGRADEPELRDDGTTKIFVGMPLRHYEIVLAPEVKNAEITEVAHNTLGIINGLHRTREYHGGPAYILWAVIHDITCIGLILLGISGLVFWFRKKKKSPLGWVILAAGWSFTFWTILYIMLSA